MDKLGKVIGELLERLRPPLERLGHPDSISQGMGDSHGVEIVAVRDGHTIHRFDFRGPRKDHSVDDLDGLIAYLERYGSEERSTVFCGGSAFAAILDDAGRPDLGAVIMPLGESLELRAWARIAAQEWSHIGFRDEIENRFDDLASKELLANLAKFRHRSVVEYDSDLDNGDGSYGFKIQEGQKGGTARVPRRFEIKIPLFEAWPAAYDVSLRLDVDVKREGEKPSPKFRVSFRDLEAAKRQAVCDMVDHLRSELGSGWVIVRGRPKAEPPVCKVR